MRFRGDLRRRGKTRERRGSEGEDVKGDERRTEKERKKVEEVDERGNREGKIRREGEERRTGRV